MAFGIQFLIFVYLYPSHRVRFFNYLVWAWGFFTLSKGTKLFEVLLPAAIDLSGPMAAKYVLAQFFIGAAALAYRYDYAIGPRYAIVGGLVALGAVWTGDLSDASPFVRDATGILLGGAQAVAACAFWSPLGRRHSISRRALARHLALVVGHPSGDVGQWLNAEPGSTTHFVVHATFVCLYFSATFAIIIMVLDRARSEVRSLKELNERLVDGLGEGLELVDGNFVIRHANRWMLEHFGPLAGRRCYEVLTADRRNPAGAVRSSRATRSRIRYGSRSMARAVDASS